MGAGSAKKYLYYKNSEPAQFGELWAIARQNPHVNFDVTNLLSSLTLHAWRVIDPKSQTNTTKKVDFRFQGSYLRFGGVAHIFDTKRLREVYPNWQGRDKLLVLVSVGVDAVALYFAPNVTSMCSSSGVVVPDSVNVSPPSYVPAVGKLFGLAAESKSFSGFWSDGFGMNVLTGRSTFQSGDLPSIVRGHHATHDDNLRNITSPTIFSSSLSLSLSPHKCVFRLSPFVYPFLPLERVLFVFACSVPSLSTIGVRTHAGRFHIPTPDWPTSHNNQPEESEASTPLHAIRRPRRWPSENGSAFPQRPQGLTSGILQFYADGDAGDGGCILPGRCARILEGGGRERGARGRGVLP